MKKKDRTLSRESLTTLLMRFDPDPQIALAKYDFLYLQLVTLFESRGCSSPRDLADDTVDRVADAIKEGKDIPSSALTAYSYGVARNILKEYWRDPVRKETPLDEVSPHNHPSCDPVEANERARDKLELERKLECLESCIKELPPKMQDVIVSYYEGEESAKIDNRQRLAESMGISPGNLRTQIHRANEKLGKCITRCLERLRKK